MTEKAPKYVLVVHDLVGPNYSKGAVVRADRFEHLDHLLAAGAVVPSDATDESATTVRQSFAETLRDGQNVTMPNMPRTDVDPDTVRSLMGVSAAEANVTTARTIDADAAAAEKDMHADRKAHVS